MNRLRQLAKKRGFWIGLLVVAVVACLIRGAIAPEILVPRGTSIRFDDFQFAIVDSRTTNLLPDDPQKRFLVVDLQVRNEAKRVPYKFRRSIAVMVDDDGREHPISAKAQEILDRQRPGPDPLAAPLPAGSAGVTKLAFELPEGAKKTRFKISHGGPMLDIVDDLLGGKKRLTP